MTAFTAAAVTPADGRVSSSGGPSDGAGGDLPSDPVPFAESLAQAVARAGSGLTNSALAKSAGMSTRTLRAILDPDSTRRFGRATLNKLDEPLGWPSGRSWQLYRAQHAAGVGEVGDIADSIQTQMEALRLQMRAFDENPPWARELVDAARVLTPEDRALLVVLARRLGRR